MNSLDRAAVLSEAMPYIQKYNKKTVVIKYGGAAMESPELKEAVISDIILLSLVGVRVVLVHGGGPEINALLKKMGKEPKFVGGLRYTDQETMDAVQMTLCGKVGKDIVSTIARQGGRAVSLSGLDGGLFRAVRMPGELDYGLVGEIKAVDPSAVNMALEHGYIPVVSTVASGMDTDSSYNINADTAAAELAAAMKAEKLILLTDVPGLLRDTSDPDSLIPLLKISDVPLLSKSGVLSKGMIPKVDCCVTAIRRGVASVSIIDGRMPHSVLVEMLTDAGVGTMIIGG